VTTYDQAPIGNPACSDPVGPGQSQELYTPDGSPVNQPFFGVPSGVHLGQIDFPTVFQGGVTTVTPLGPFGEGGFVTGRPGAAYSVSTTADYLGPVQVCLRYDAAAYPAGVMPRLYASSTQGGAWVDITTTPLDFVNDGDLICGSEPVLPARVALLYPSIERDGFWLREASVTNRPGTTKGRPGQVDDTWGFSGGLGICGNAMTALLRDIDDMGVGFGLAVVLDGVDGPSVDSLAFSTEDCRTEQRGRVVCAKSKPSRSSKAVGGGAAGDWLGKALFTPLAARKGAACRGLSIKASFTGRSIQAQSLVSSKKVKYWSVVSLSAGSDVYKASLFSCRLKSQGRGTMPAVKLACRAARK
jgi:hypothetical protein